MNRICAHCPNPITRRPKESTPRYMRRQYCSMACWHDKQREGGVSQQRPYERTAGRYEDLTMLLDAGESLHHIPDRLGTTAGALARWLHRYGYHQEARLFDRAEIRRAA